MLKQCSYKIGEHKSWQYRQKHDDACLFLSKDTDCKIGWEKDKGVGESAYGGIDSKDCQRDLYSVVT